MTPDSKVQKERKKAEEERLEAEARSGGPEPQQRKLEGGVGKGDFVKATHRANFIFSVMFFSSKISIWFFPFI